MNYCVILAVLLVILILINIFPSEFREGHRLRLRHRRHGNRRHRNERRWYGQNWGYRYNPPPRITRWAWAPFVWNIPFWNTRLNPFCPTGCSNLGRGRWGCTNPGYGSNDCWFSSDCAPCGYY